MPRLSFLKAIGLKRPKTNFSKCNFKRRLFRLLLSLLILKIMNKILIADASESWPSAYVGLAFAGLLWADSCRQHGGGKRGGSKTVIRRQLLWQARGSNSGNLKNRNTLNILDWWNCQQVADIPFCRLTPFRCQATHRTTLSLDAWLKKTPTDMKATGKHKDIRSNFVC